MYSRCMRNIHHRRTLVQDMLQPCPALRSEASSFSSTLDFAYSHPVHTYRATVELRRSLGNPLVPFEVLGTPRPLNYANL